MMGANIIRVLSSIRGRLSTYTPFMGVAPTSSVEKSKKVEKSRKFKVDFFKVDQLWLDRSQRGMNGFPIKLYQFEAHMTTSLW